MEARELDYAAAKVVASGRKPLWHYAVTLGALAGCLLSTRWTAILATDWYQYLPRIIGNWLFFLDQTAFPYSRLHGWGGAPFIRSIGGVLSALQWLIVAAGLLWLTKRIRLWYVLALVPVVVAAVTEVVPEMLYLFGTPVSLDGP